jgi:hypothetical protein
LYIHIDGQHGQVRGRHAVKTQRLAKGARLVLQQLLHGLPPQALDGLIVNAGRQRAQFQVLQAFGLLHLPLEITFVFGFDFNGFQDRRRGRAPWIVRIGPI